MSVIFPADNKIIVKNKFYITPIDNIEFSDKKYYIALMKQLDLISDLESNKFRTLKHGGAPSKKIKGKRKTKRPLFKNKSIHLVFKSNKAFGKLSLFYFEKQIKTLLLKRSKSDFFQILDYVNMGNHLHCHLKPQDIQKFKNFLRVFPGLIARMVTKAKKGKAFGVFWDGLVFSRVLRTSFEVLSLKGYFKANRIEKQSGSQNRERFWLEFKQFLFELKKE